jgi:phage N-6-adenine-methyltransferase
MADFSERFKSTRQNWTTPDTVFHPLAREFAFTLDAAASAENTRAPLFFDEATDGLSQSWGANVVWLNPPYGCKKSKTSDWVKKAHRESLGGATVVMLIPARTNTRWFHNYCLKYGEVRFICGRPKFGDADHGLPLPLCIVVFRPRIPAL